MSQQQDSSVNDESNNKSVSKRHKKHASTLNSEEREYFKKAVKSFHGLCHHVEILNGHIKIIPTLYLTDKIRHIANKINPMLVTIRQCTTDIEKHTTSLITLNKGKINKAHLMEKIFQSALDSCKDLQYDDTLPFFRNYIITHMERTHSSMSDPVNINPTIAVLLQKHCNWLVARTLGAVLSSIPSFSLKLDCPYQILLDAFNSHINET